MKIRLLGLFAGLSLVALSSPVPADDLEGAIESIDRAERSFTVQGIMFFATPSTDYDDGLGGFDELQEGQKVEVDFQYRDGKHYATEIESDD